MPPELAELAGLGETGPEVAERDRPGADEVEGEDTSDVGAERGRGRREKDALSLTVIDGCVC